jgi:NAD(P)H-dependent FMN reductase
MKNYLLFAGSNNPKSINQALVAAIAAKLNDPDNTLINPNDYELPLYCIDIQLKGIPKPAIALRKLLNEHRAVIIAVAENNGSVSAFFKNLLDWLSRAGEDYRVFQNKNVILVSVSPGTGGGGALSHAEAILVRLGAKVIHKQSLTNFYQQAAFTANGLELHDKSFLDSIHKVAITN